MRLLTGLIQAALLKPSQSERALPRPRAKGTATNESIRNRRAAWDTSGSDKIGQKIGRAEKGLGHDKVVIKML